MTTSIMFATYNRLELTKRMMGSLINNTRSAYRLIIIDNGSTDGTVEWLKSISTEFLNIASDSLYCQGLDIRFNEKNWGIAVARNQGLELSDKYNDPWLSTLDNDIEFPNNWLTDCVEIIQSNPKLALGVNMEGTAYPLTTRGGKTFQLKPMGNLGTACTVFERELHQQLGFFNTEYGLYGEEDADFFFRARQAGWDLGYLKEMGVHFGQGELDVGEYRQFKDSCRTGNLSKFRQNCMDYASRRRSLYIPFSNPTNNS